MNFLVSIIYHPFHIEIFKFSNENLTNHMFIDIYKVVYQYFLPKA
jgi:hypothetical protein